MPVNVYRNESLIQMETYEATAAAVDELVDAVRAKWSLLREHGFAGDYPVQVLRGGRNGTDTIKVVEVFRWRSVQDRVSAEADPDYVAMAGRISALTVTEAPKETFTEAVRGFNHNFPSIGGVELLKAPNTIC